MSQLARYALRSAVGRTRLASLEGSLESWKVGGVLIGRDGAWERRRNVLPRLERNLREKVTRLTNRGYTMRTSLGG